MPELLAHGYAALKSATGAPRRGERVTVDNVRRFHASKETMAQARAALEREGFSIRGVSPLGISIAGPPALFERAFRARLLQKTYHPFGRPVRVRGKVLTRKYFSPQGELAVPPHLSDLLEYVRLAPPIRWFATPDAPALGYYHLDVPEDVQRLIDAHAAHDQGINGAGVRICVIDSGFHPHEWYAAHGFAITLVGANSPDDDDVGHGTGITTNAMAVAPGAQFFGVKLDWDGAAAFQLARTTNPHVITCSWGTWWFDAALHDEIVDAVAHNITVCFACGNGPGGAAWPGSMAEVVSVGGTYIDEHGAMQASNYASSGTNANEPGRQCPDVCGLTGLNPHGIYIAMPTQDGSDLDGDFHNGGAAFPDGDETAADDGWLVASGTSSATPQVAGVAALILQHTPGLTPAQVKTELQNCCRDVTAGSSANGDAAGPGFDNATGWGLVDAFIAVHPVDIWCRDCADDNGCVPNTYPHAWTSPDVWVRAADDHGPDVGLNPEHGQANWVYVRVRNRGRQAANNVQVHLYWADPSTAIVWPADWKTDGIKVDGAAGNTRVIGTIPAGGEAVTDAFEWWPPDPDTAGDPGHFCLLVRVECPDDPIVHEGDVRGGNNIAMRNVHVVDLLPDMEFTFKIQVGAPPKLEGKATLAIDRAGTPKTVLVELGPAIARAVTPAATQPPGAPRAEPPALPAAAVAAAPAIRPVGAVTRPMVVEPLNLVAGQRQEVQVRIKAPRGARPGQVFRVGVDQYVGEANTGHVTLMARVVKEAKYVGDRSTLTVHRWGCPGIAQVRPENRLLIKTVDAARAMKYQPCARCRPA
ncbi:MAG: S8 family serine peptidase [Acetobacteraceae bacterium]|nr:S8 family serine peptidase [Acetobacteraceae bacterium]